jgi:Rps23 Pro-64 3,4-dihydroxylase Tpa1-like proline 4-hydroxylase
VKLRTRPAKRIEPKASRLVLFAVSETALHQVREVTSGDRASIAGWLYP